MKPAAFEIVRPASLAEACAILRDGAGSAKAVAGSQSLGPMLNLRLVQPRILVDITGLPEMTEVAEDQDGLTIGACITTADIEDARVTMSELPILASVAGGVAYRAVRNRGTIGGSLCHADPAGDWLPFLCALGAECMITNGSALRRVPVDRFVTGAFETALADGELLQAIFIPRPSPAVRSAYYKICRKAGEFALASGAVLFDPERDRWRAAMGATQGRPIVIEDARSLFGRTPWPGGALRLDQDAVRRLLDGAGINAAMARQLHLTALKRAAAQAMAA